MQASYLWKKLFTKKHLKARYEEKIKNKPSIGLDKVSKAYSLFFPHTAL